MRARVLAGLVLVTLGSPTIASDKQIIQGTRGQVPHSAVQWANRGLELFDQGDFEAAIDALYEAWKMNPAAFDKVQDNLCSAYNNYAKQTYEGGDVEAAISLARRAVFFCEKNRVARDNLNVLLRKAGQDPEDHEFRLSQARELRSQGYVEPAVAEYLAALETSPKEKRDEIKMELAQVYQVIYAKYTQSPVGARRLRKLAQIAVDLHKNDPQDPRPHILLARAYLAAGDLGTAIDSYENALELDPDNSEAKTGLIAAWRKVIEVAPEQKENFLGLASALRRAGKPKQAIPYLQKARSLAPEDEQIASELAAAKSEVANAEAFELARRASRAQESEQPERALALYDRALEELPKGSAQKADFLYNMAIIEEQRGNLRAARAKYQRAQEVSPDHQPSRQALADLRQQEQQQAETELRQAVELQKSGQVRAAIDKYRSILEDNPDDAQTHFNLGTAYQTIGAYPQALRHYQKAKRLQPANREFANAVESVKAAQERKLETSDKFAKLLHEGVKLQKAGKYAEALKNYRQAETLRPKNAQLHYNMATTHHGLGNLTKAILEYRQAYALAPATYPEANYFAGVLLETIGESRSAVAYYRRYLEEMPEGRFAISAEERLQKLPNRGVPKIGTRD